MGGFSWRVILCCALLVCAAAELAAQTQLRPGVAVSGSLGASSRRLSDGRYHADYDYRGAAGQRVAITAASHDFDVEVVLYSCGTECVEVARGDDEPGWGLHARLEATLPITGNYTIVVLSHLPRRMGSYTVMLWEDVGSSGSRFRPSVSDPPLPSCANSSEGTRSPVSPRGATVNGFDASVLPLDTPVVRYFTDRDSTAGFTPWRRHWWTFEGVHGQVVCIELTPVGINGGGWIETWRSVDELVMGKPLRRTESGRWVLETLLREGTYMLRVDQGRLDLATAPPGSYTLTMRRR